jgi:carbonic anhydrase
MRFSSNISCPYSEKQRGRPDEKSWGPTKPMPPSKLPKSLVEGHRRFLRDRHAPERARYRQLAELGQAPTAMVIACCDARVDVSTVFDAGPGELFTLRNVANLVPPYEAEGKYHGTSAAIEFAIITLKVPHLIVLGHSRCGGVATYRQTVREKIVPEQGFIGRWLTLLNHVKVSEPEVAFGEELAFELAAIRSSLANLRTFPFIREREEEGLLRLHGLHFDLASGQLVVLDEASERFEALNAD